MDSVATSIMYTVVFLWPISEWAWACACACTCACVCVCLSADISLNCAKND